MLNKYFGSMLFFINMYFIPRIIIKIRKANNRQIDYKIRRSIKRRLASDLIIFILSLSICGVLFIITLPEDENIDPIPYTKEHRLEVLLSQIDFKSEVLSSETLIWEDVIVDYLDYKLFTNWNADSNISKVELRKKYLTKIGEKSNSVLISLDEIKATTNQFYGTSLLPETFLTLEQIDEITPALVERMFTDPNIYKAEFYLRLNSCSTDSNYDNLYQAARAGDDVFKTSVSQNNPSTKELLLFSSGTYVLYQHALRVCDDICQSSFIHYRGGELLFSLYKNLQFDNDSVISQDELSEHFLLSAEAHLLQSREEFEMQNDSMEDIHARQTYHDSYLCEIEYDLIMKYGHNDEDIISACIKHAQSYISSDFARPGGVSTCENILIKLENKGYNIDNYK